MSYFNKSDYQYRENGAVTDVYNSSGDRIGCNSSSSYSFGTAHYNSSGDLIGYTNYDGSEYDRSGNYIFDED